MNRYKITLAAFVICASLQGQTPVKSDNPSIIENITADSVNFIIQDEEMNELLEFAPAEKKNRNNSNVGYRVQVFSDNNQRTARNEARVKQRNIHSRFPQYGCYVTFTAPYWRVRIGDFQTQEEATKVLSELRRAFPSYAREMRVVRDRVKVTKPVQ